MAYGNRLKELGGIASNSIVQVNNSGTCIKSTAMTVTSGDIVSLPFVPMLIADATTSQTNVTGNGTAYQVQFPNIRYQQGSNFTSNKTYTAPVDGFYIFKGCVGLGSIGTITQLQLWVVSRSSKILLWNTTGQTLRDNNLNLVVNYAGGFYAPATDAMGVFVQLTGAGSDNVSVLGAGSPITALTIGMVV